MYQKNILVDHIVLSIQHGLSKTTSDNETGHLVFKMGCMHGLCWCLYYLWLYIRRFTS